MIIQCLKTDGCNDSYCVNKKHNHWVTYNEKYFVYNIAITNCNKIIYLIVDDHKKPFYHTSELFFIFDSSLIGEWYIQKDRWLMCGYKELIFKKEHSDNILEREPEDLELFNVRKNQIEMNGMIPWYWKQRRLNEKKGISMKLICLSNSASSLDKAVREKLSFEEDTSFNLLIGSVYIAYGMYAVNGALFYLVLGENSHFPTLYPAELFALKDQLLPIEWYFNYTQKKEAIWGYKPLALDSTHLALLLEQDPMAVSLFEKYKNQIDEWERMP